MENAGELASHDSLGIRFVKLVKVGRSLLGLWKRRCDAASILSMVRSEMGLGGAWAPSRGGGGSELNFSI